MLLEQDEKHAIQIQRLATRLYKEEVFKSLERANEAASSIILKYESINTKRVMNEISAAVAREISPILDDAWLAVTDELTEFAVYESGFYAALLTKASQEVFTEPAEDKVKRYVSTALMSLEGNRPRVGVWAEFIKEQSDSVAKTYQSIIKQSYVNDITTREAVQELKRVTDGILANEAQSLVRTGVQHYSTQARLAMRDENKKIIAREYPITVFDNKRSITCTNIQAKYGIEGWEVGKSPIGYPPYHFGCRTIIGFLPIGMDKAEGYHLATFGKDTEAAEEAYEKRKSRTDKKVTYRGRKDSSIFETEKVSAQTPLDKVMKRQPRWWLESTLGVAKTKLFLDGGLSLTKIADATGRPLTLKELRQVDVEAFRRAGI